jgi:hypothetical protein
MIDTENVNKPRARYPRPRRMCLLPVVCLRIESRCHASCAASNGSGISERTAIERGLFESFSERGEALPFALRQEQWYRPL